MAAKSKTQKKRRSSGETPRSTDKGSRRCVLPRQEKKRNDRMRRDGEGFNRGR